MNNHNFTLVANDTDSISFRKQDGSSFSKEEQTSLLNEINSLLPDGIIFEDDGYFETVVVLKAKNYILRDFAGKVTYKGSGVKDSKKEPALREMMNELFQDLMDNNGINVNLIYQKYVKEALNISDISRWCVKKTISKSVLSPQRANEQKILDAVSHLDIQEGDKYLLYSAIDGEKVQMVKGEPKLIGGKKCKACKGSGCPECQHSGYTVKPRPKMVANTVLKVKDEFDGNYDVWHYVERVYKTLDILKNVIDMDEYTKYHLKSNRKLVEEL